MRVAIAQAYSPLSLQRGLDAAEGWISRAADAGARLIVFPETWIPGYPSWLDLCRDVAIWDSEPVRDVYERTVAESLDLQSPEALRLMQMAADHGVTVVMGVMERVGEGAGRGTLYNSLLSISTTGSLLNHHRKLMPTHGERLLWGIGDAEGLKSIKANDVRVGGLICWEHWMPLARQAMHIAGEDIHVAVWPSVLESHLIASRHYAFEGRCYVLAAGSILQARDLPSGLDVHPDKVKSPDQMVLRGGSCVIGPDGTLLTGQVFDREELIVADLPLERRIREHLTLDVTGHYSRSDVLELIVRRHPR